MEARYDVFARTENEKWRAYRHLAALGSSGSDGTMIEVAVCADCGWWDRWDNELERKPDQRVHIACTHPSGYHLITRVLIKPVPPGG